MILDQPGPGDAELWAALDWYRAAGVEFALADDPIDRFAASQAAPRRQAVATAPTVAAQAPPGPQPTALGNATPSEARALAATAESLEALRALLEQWDGCALKLRATQLCFADGNPEAEVMLVGEAPGAEEDRMGKPFVGRAGQLLDRMLAAIGLDRGQVYIANVVAWRPPGNRNPTSDEIAACLPFLERQVALVGPKILVTLGNVPTQTLFGISQGITRTRGQWRELSVGGHQLMAMPTLHPAYLLRQPASKRQVWQDLLSLRARMRELGIA
jgi:DNA polymerase